MHTFVAIIGGRNSGKSTIIKSLTGCPSGQFRGAIQDTASGKSIEVIGSSPQERPMSLADLRKILRGVAADINCNGMVCAIQPTLPSKRLSMETVLNEALAYGFTVHAYALDPERSGATGHAVVINGRLTAIGLRARVLDAREFAHKNAERINAHTRIAS